MENINRHNYETWLMLYLDNELTASERQSVDAFLEQHPDLKQELQGLKEVTLESTVPATMPGKDRLLRPEVWNAESLTLQQEQLLMMADGTLQDGEKQKLEAEIRQSPLLQKEWGLLQKTIIKADLPNEMPGKSSLYRNEKAKTVSMVRWYRIAAAAAILAFGWFFTANMLAPVGTTKIPEMAVVEEKEPSSTKTPGKVDTAAEDMVKNDKELKEVPGITAVENKLQAPREKIAELKTIGNKPENKADLNNQSIALEETNQKMVVIKDIAGSPVLKNIDIDGVDATLPTTIGTETNTTFIKVTEEAPVRNYEVLGIEEDDEEGTINIAGARISKQKVRGFYRNITRPLAKTFDKNSQRTNETK